MADEKENEIEPEENEPIEVNKPEEGEHEVDGHPLKPT